MATDRGAGERLFELVYPQLRALAFHLLRGERPDHTLQPTALVHEAWLKLIDQSSVDWANRAHFLGIAAQAMRRILVDHARGKKRQKRGVGWERVDLEGAPPELSGEGVDLVELDEALDRLREQSERQVRVVELRFFAGLTHEEIARVLDVSERTVEREWRMARAWLLVALGEKG